MQLICEYYYYYFGIHGGYSFTAPIFKVIIIYYSLIFMICILCGLAPQFFSKARVDKLLCSVNIPWGTRGSFIGFKL